MPIIIDDVRPYCYCDKKDVKDNSDRCWSCPFNKRHLKNAKQKKKGG